MSNRTRMGGGGQGVGSTKQPSGTEGGWEVGDSAMTTLAGT